MKKTLLFFISVCLLSFATSCSDNDDNDGKEVIPPDGGSSTLTDLTCLQKIVDENNESFWTKDIWQIDLVNIDNPNNYKLPGVTWNMETKRVVNLKLESMLLCPIPLDLRPLTALDSLSLIEEGMSEILLPETPTLTYVKCTGAVRITKVIDVSKVPNLRTLWFADNRDLGNNGKPLGGILDLSNNLELVELYCENNNFSEVKFSKCTKLEDVSLYWNDIHSVDFSNQPNLREANVGFGETDYLDYLNVSKNLKLEMLFCSAQITDLDVSNNILLKELYCDKNNLKELDITNNVNLELLSCGDNKLSKLDVSKNVKLKELYFFNNDINSIDLSQNIILELLSCYKNDMTSLDLSHNPLLADIKCQINLLTALDITNNPLVKGLNCSNNVLGQNSVSVCKTTWDKWTITNGTPINPERTDPIYNVVNCN